MEPDPPVYAQVETKSPVDSSGRKDRTNKCLNAQLLFGTTGMPIEAVEIEFEIVYRGVHYLGRGTEATIPSELELPVSPRLFIKIAEEGSVLVFKGDRWVDTGIPVSATSKLHILITCLGEREGAFWERDDLIGLMGLGDPSDPYARGRFNTWMAEARRRTLGVLDGYIKSRHGRSYVLKGLNALIIRPRGIRF